jgi:hypothetical protein
MPIMWRTRFVWTGWPGANGYTTLYGNGTVPAQTFASAAGAFMKDVALLGAAVLGAYPQVVRITQDAQLTSVEDSDGKEQGVATITPVAQIVGTGTNSFGASTGMSITWNTANFINGRRLRGRTYLVPLSSGAFQTDGTLLDSYRTSALAAATAYIGSGGQPVVWHRPTSKGATDGSNSLALSASIIDHTATLSSRRA